MNTRMVTYTGNVVDLANLQGPPSIYDIAWHLAHTNRFNGACKVNYTVAEHSVRAASLALHNGEPPSVCLGVLLHDAHEAYTGDITRPFKSLMPPAVAEWFHATEERVINWIYGGLGVPRCDYKYYDNAILAEEMANLRMWTPEALGAFGQLLPGKPLSPLRFFASGPTEAYEMFLEHFTFYKSYP